MAAGYGRYVFVYGTLRRGELRDINRLLPSPLWMGDTSIDGILFDIGAYPGIRLGGPGRTGWVMGEVYAISAGLEAQLDVIEAVWPEHNAEYIKRHVPVQTAAVRGVAQPSSAFIENCLVYEAIPERTRGRPIISSGDWVSYRLKLLSNQS